MPPVTDKRTLSSFWYSFDLAHRRIQDGGWTRQVTAAELPTSLDLAGVQMRLTAGSYRELHWHTAKVWAYMLYGNARLTVMNPDGTIFIGDVSDGDLWYFPSGYPHSIQGLGPDGCEFLLVFDEGTFSEYTTFLISGWLAHTPPDVLSKNCKLSDPAVRSLPEQEGLEALYIFPGTVPGSLADDKKAVSGAAVASKIDYTFRRKSMKATVETAGGDARVVDSDVFPASKVIAAALVRAASEANYIAGAHEYLMNRTVCRGAAGKEIARGEFPIPPELETRHSRQPIRHVPKCSAGGEQSLDRPRIGNDDSSVSHLRPDCFEKHLAPVPGALDVIPPKSPLEKRGLAA